MTFDYAPVDLEIGILAREAKVSTEIASGLVQIAVTARNLKGHGLTEGISTRLLVYAASLIRDGADVREACRMALVEPITDDADIRDTLLHAIDAIFG
jgi:nitric oxide reductase NorQ protein